MKLIPAIDLKQGQCVRLRQGRMDSVTVFGDDPVSMARHWAGLGAQRLHVVDLDGAVAGATVQRAIVHSLIAACPQLQIQIGGGIRSERDVEDYLGAGAAAVVLGTRAVEDADFVAALCKRFPGQIIIGLDARAGRLATAGWTEESALEIIPTAQRLAAFAPAAMIYTDIARDGMLHGIDIASTARLAEAVSVPVIASGGLRGEDDIVALKAAAGGRIAGVIAGRALYQGELDFSAALALAESE